MNVFCWLGWKHPSSVYSPTEASAAVAEPGLRTLHLAARGKGAEASVPGERPQRDDHAEPSSAASSRSRNGRHRSRSWGVRLVSPVARSALPRRRSSPADAARRRGQPTSAWFARPTRCSDAKRKSPERSPVKTRPVRLPPCAAGASPSTSTDPRRRVPEAGHRAGPICLVREPGRLLDRHPLSPRDEPRTCPAVDDLFRDARERAGHRTTSDPLTNGCYERLPTDPNR